MSTTTQCPHHAAKMAATTIASAVNDIVATSMNHHHDHDKMMAGDHGNHGTHDDMMMVSRTSIITELIQIFACNFNLDVFPRWLSRNHTI